MTIKTETLHSNIETVNSKQLAILKKNFPQCFDKEGNFIQEKMLEVVNANEVELSKESYTLNWLGKSYARLLTNLPPKTLINEDIAHNQLEQNKGSKNLLIKGDNLEVLKHMVNAYSEKVKMIYIDPPYNTGSDGFIYNDDRKFTKEQLMDLAGVDFDEASRILEFTDKGSSSHSAWLTFIYPRLYITRELLSQQGVIFVSIGNDEVGQLRLVLDEIYGEQNFIAMIARQMKSGGAKGSFFTPNVEYILVYAKEKLTTKNFRASISEEQIKTYYNKVEKSGVRTGEKYGEERLYKASLDARPNQRYWIECPDGSFVIPPGNTFPESHKNGLKVTPNKDDGVWKWTYDRYKKEYDQGNIIFKETKTSALVNNSNKKSKYNIYNKLWLAEQQEKGKVPSDIILNWENRESSAELKLMDIPFDYAKPSNLIKYLIELARTEKDDVILDFFAGSGTTGHAVQKVNANDNGKRRYILIQLPESVQEGTEAFKKGYKKITDLTENRLKKIPAQLQHSELDNGFKIFETTEDFRVEDDDKELSLMTMTMFDDVVLTDEQYHTLLTSWRLYDGSELTTPIQDIDLDGYKTHLCDRRLYMIAPDFSSSALKALLEKLDTDKEFSPNKIVFFGKNFDSVKQMELNEALKSYANKKSLEIDLVGRN